MWDSLNIKFCCGRKAIRLKFVSGSIYKIEPETQANFYYKQDLLAIGDDFFLFTIILNTNATMMYNADLGG